MLQTCLKKVMRSEAGLKSFIFPSISVFSEYLQCLPGSCIVRIRRFTWELDNYIKGPHLNGFRETERSQCIQKTEQCVLNASHLIKVPRLMDHLHRAKV